MPEGDAKRAVFLDRDGVLNAAVVRNGRPYPPATPDEVRIIEGVPEACAALHEAGVLLFCVTNQPDVARGLARRRDVEEIDKRLSDALRLDDFEACFHDDGDDCDCRKPKPGMLLRLADRHNVDLARSVMVGDRWRDVEAGHRAGCRTVFIDYGYEEDRPANADLEAGSLLEALPGILKLLNEGNAR